MRARTVQTLPRTRNTDSSDDKWLNIVHLIKSAETLTFSSCISVLFILWDKHRAAVRAEGDHRGALLGSTPTRVRLTPADWTDLPVAQLPD